MKKESVNLENRIIELSHGEFGKTKSKKPGNISIHDELIEVLKYQLDITKVNMFFPKISKKKENQGFQNCFI